jgi:hypothetical protein
VNLPVFRISFQNATLLSGFYLLVATFLEVVRRVWNPRWAEKACLAMESFPARALDLAGALEPLKRWYAWGDLTQLQVRLLFGLTTVGIIFLLAMAVGGGMWAFARAIGREEALLK